MQAKSPKGAREFERVQAGSDELAERIKRVASDVDSSPSRALAGSLTALG
jgi:hypothetical protein